MVLGFKRRADVWMWMCVFILHVSYEPALTAMYSITQLQQTSRVRLYLLYRRRAGWISHLFQIHGLRGENSGVIVVLGFLQMSIHNISDILPMSWWRDAQSKVEKSRCSITWTFCLSSRQYILEPELLVLMKHMYYCQHFYNIEKKLLDFSDKK